MAGYHVVQRTTKLEMSNVVKAVSTLKLPSNCTCRENNPTGSGIHGAFPEFIQGIFGGSYGHDTGIMYQNGNFIYFTTHFLILHKQHGIKQKYQAI